MMRIDGRLVRRYRELAGYSVRELAKRLGVDSSSLSSWERNLYSPRPGMVKKLADALKVGTEEICPIESPGLSGSLACPLHDCPSKGIPHQPLTAAMLADWVRLSDEQKRDVLVFTGKLLSA